MKKLPILLLTVLTVFVCSTTVYGAKKVEKQLELKTLNDSVNYFLGLTNGCQIKNYYLANDSSEKTIAAFMEALDRSYQGKVEQKPELIQVAEQIGSAIKDQEAEGLVGVPQLKTDFELIKQGFLDGIHHNSAESYDQASAYLQTTIEVLKFGDTKQAGENFLAQNALHEGVTTTASGLQYEVITLGTGAKPAATDRVKVHYEGTLIDGTIFDSSYQRGEPITFALNQVIQGWTEGLQLMPVGSKFKFYIPQELGYGSREAGSIPPYSTLIFTVELLDIE